MKTGAGTLTLTGTALGELGKTDRDAVFGIDKDVYATLASNGGVLNLGVNSGKMIVDLTGNRGATLSSGNGTNIDLVSLRDAASREAGTLVVKSSANPLRALPASAQEFAETISGGGNVTFDGTAGAGLVVSSKQATLGQTVICGNVEFSGAGRDNASSLLTVDNDATLHGGVNMVGRTVDYSVNAVRNTDDTGAAGSATLTITLNDARLPSSMKYQVEVLANDTIGTVTQLGELPAGMDSVSASDLTYKNGVLTFSLTDTTYGNEKYSVVVDAGTLPSVAGGKTSATGSSLVAGNVSLTDGATVVLDATAGDKIAVGAGNVEIGTNASIRVENLGTETLGKTITLVRAGTVNELAEGPDKTEEVVKALRKANDTRPTEKMNLMVYTDQTSGEICAKMIISDFGALDADYNEGISDSFLGALSDISSPENYGAIINADALNAGKDKELFFALNGLSASQLGEEVNKLSPISYAAMLAMPVAAFNSDVARIHSRLDQRRYDGAEPLRETGEYEFFALAQSDFAENATATDAPVYDYNLYGVTAGFDWKPDFETTLGLALGYTYGKAKIHNGGGKINMDDMRVTAFAGRLFGNCYVDAGVQAGMAMFDVRRNTIAGTTSGDTDSIFAGTFITVGSVYSLWQDKKDGSGLYFTPSIGLSYLHTEIDGFRESGVAGLRMDDAEGDSLRARISAAIQWAFPMDSWQVRLGMEVAYSHDFLGEELDTDGRFVAGGSKFSTSGKALPTDIISFGPTVDIMVSERSSLYFGYGLDVDTDSGVSQNVNAGFRHRF